VGKDMAPDRPVARLILFGRLALVQNFLQLAQFVHNRGVLQHHPLDVSRRDDQGYSCVDSLAVVGVSPIESIYASGIDIPMTMHQAKEQEACPAPRTRMDVDGRPTEPTNRACLYQVNIYLSESERANLILGKSRNRAHTDDWLVTCASDVASEQSNP
jgi:hypothetical protein